MTSLPGLEAALATLAREGRTAPYAALARDLGLTGPGTIARLTDALETSMEVDAASGKPLRAAVLCQKLSSQGLPAPGFFLKAHSLGYRFDDLAAFVADHRRRLITV